MFKGCRSGKTLALVNLINHQPVIDRIFLYAKNSYGLKYQLLINKRKTVGLNSLKDSEAFIEYSSFMQEVCKIVEEYNRAKYGQKQKVLTVFDAMMAGMISNKKASSISH